MESVGRYRLSRRLGQGGMAEVLEAVALGQGGFQRRVAIKRMLPAFRDVPSFGRMFLDEARIASQLHHANIVGVLDYGVADGVPFQVLEYVDGVNVRHLLELAQQARLELPVELALWICTELAHALEYAHAACDPEARPLGIVHRDVSPANILVSWSGDVKLTDFGIAFARDRIETTSVGEAKGTRLYMAPEQVLQGEVDGRTDLFALGCVLQRLIAGYSPLRGEEGMQKLLTGHELGLDPLLPPDVWDIIRRATRASKQDRYENATEMAAALGAALALRVAQDAKGLLRSWLAPLKPALAQTPLRGQLDELVNVELVLRGTEDDTRCFVTTGPVTAPARALRAAGSDAQGAGRRSWKRWLALGLGLATAATIAAVAWWPVQRGLTEVALPPEVAARAQPGPPAGTEATVERDQGDRPQSLPSRKQPTGRREHERMGGRGGRREAQPENLAATAGRSMTTGFVVVGGEGALRSEILVDGKASGFAPKKLELPVGRHVLELLTPNGNRIGPHAITVTARNTTSAPLSWILSSEP